MGKDDLLDANEESNITPAEHSGAKTFMIIMTVIWVLLLMVDFTFISIFSWLFFIAESVENGAPGWSIVSLLYWNFLLYPVVALIGIAGGFMALSRRNYSLVYFLGLLPAANVVLFFVLLNIAPQAAM